MYLHLLINIGSQASSFTPVSYLKYETLIERIERELRTRREKHKNLIEFTCDETFESLDRAKKIMKLSSENQELQNEFDSLDQMHNQLLEYLKHSNINA